MFRAYVRSRADFLAATWPGRQASVFVIGVAVVHLVAVWCNSGFLNADEHYQIVEFAQYMLGYQPAASLAWEFPAHMRPALQPWLASLAIRGHQLAGISSPFAIALSLRLLSSLLATIASFELCVRCLRPVSSPWARKAGLFLAMFLWIVPTVHGRFSSENWGGIWLAAGLCCLLDADDRRQQSRARSIGLAACAGLAWSIAFYCRFQMAIAIAGAGLWLLVVRRRSAWLIPAIALSFVAGCAANEALNHGLYNVWTLVPANYFDQNLVQGNAAQYGVAPWWMTGVYAAIILIPPFSLAVVGLLVIGSWRARRHVIVWTAVPFAVVHTMLHRKDARFLIPLLYLLGPWIALSLDSLPRRLQAWFASPWTRAAVTTFCVIDLLLLCIAIVLPANDHIAMDRWLWEQGRQGLRVVYTIDRVDTGLPANVTDSFYRSDIVMTPFASIGRTSAADLRTPVFVYYKGTAVPAPLTGIHCAVILRTYPDWLTRLAFFRRLTHIEPATICRLDDLR